VRATGTAAWSGTERQIVNQAYLHHLAGFDREITDCGGHERTPLGRWDRRMVAQHVLDGALPSTFDQRRGGLTRLDEHPDTGRGRLVVAAAENRDQLVNRRVGAGFVARTRLICLRDIPHQVNKGLVGAHRTAEDRHRMHGITGPQGLQGNRVQDRDRQRASALVSLSSAEPADGGAQPGDSGRCGWDRRHHERRVVQDGKNGITVADLLHVATLRPRSFGTGRKDVADNGRVTSASDLASLAALLADETRAAICLALLDGRGWDGGGPAVHTKVSPSTATEHLHRLIDGGLLVERRQGRHRYVQLAGPLVAHLIEDLSAQTEPRPTTAHGLRAATASAALRRGRTCYDHLAGRLGVAVTDAMTAAGLLDQTGGFALTTAGLAWLTDTLGLSPEELRPGKRPLARGCLDWTERRQHLAGLAGAKLCETFIGNGWVARIGSGRAVRLTSNGKAELRDLLGLSDID
jgi:DNA-binding transcriptional ArsR family regulator